MAQRPKVVKSNSPKSQTESISPEAASRGRAEALRNLRARVLASPRRKKGSVADFKAIFAPAKPPPGVLPPKASVSHMAMDTAGWGEFGFAPSAVSAYYASSYAEGQQFLGYAVLAVLAQRAEYRVITETLASDMTREWIRFEASKSAEEDKNDKIAELEDFLDNLGLKAVMKQSIEHDGFQGRGQVYVDLGINLGEVGESLDDITELKTPIGNGRDDISKLKIKKGSLRRLQPIEPMWTYPYQYNASNPLRADWYRPETWFVMGTEVHRSRLITFVGRPVPDILKPSYSFGGLSMTQMAKPYVDLWLRDRTSASDLLNGFSTFVLLTTLDSQSMSFASGDELFERIATFNAIRDNMGMMALNKATEDFKNVSASLAGVNDLVAQAQEHVASVAQIPTAKLLGIQPAGLNADSEGIIRLYYDRIKAFQESLLRAPMTTIIDIAQMSLWGEVDPDIIFSFNDLWQLDAAGKAAIQLTKAQVVETDITSGVIDPEEGRKARASDPESPYAGLDLDEREAPGMEMENEEEAAVASGGKPQGPIAPKDAGETGERLARSVAEQGAEFGGPQSGGFVAHDSRPAVRRKKEKV